MQFPTSLVAGLAKAEPAELWEIEDAGERAVPQVDLSTEARHLSQWGMAEWRQWRNGE